MPGGSGALWPDLRCDGTAVIVHANRTITAPFPRAARRPGGVWWCSAGLGDFERRLCRQPQHSPAPRLWLPRRERAIGIDQQPSDIGATVMIAQHAGAHAAGEVRDLPDHIGPSARPTSVLQEDAWSASHPRQRDPRGRGSRAAQSPRTFRRGSSDIKNGAVTGREADPDRDDRRQMPNSHQNAPDGCGCGSQSDIRPPRITPRNPDRTIGAKDESSSSLETEHGFGVGSAQKASA